MRKQSYTVIGAGYGDEGKGNIVSHLAETIENPIVIRYNGGAQAGHTVVRGNIRHVFSHFGSGTLFYVPTYLAPSFISNPLLFHEEREELLQKIPTLPPVYVSPLSQISTPFDVYVNQYCELGRKHKHGSVGVGIWETLNRGDQMGPLIYSHLVTMSKDFYFYYMKRIWKEYVPKRFAEEGVVFAPEINVEMLLEDFWEKIQYFLQHTKPHLLLTLPHSSFIFEGGQGILLDQHISQNAPFLTPSCPGLNSAQNCLFPLNCDINNIIYVTRTYSTRHGKGPFDGELDHLPYEKIQDFTNLSHPFQGEMRYGFLNLERLRKAIIWDKFHAGERNILCKFSLAITCVDQLPSYFSYVTHGKEKTIPSSQCLSTISEYVKLPISYIGKGEGEVCAISL